MIVTHIIGGLGNQLFQYALGRQLSIKHKTKLYFDASDFTTYKLHNYTLSHFNVNGVLASRIKVIGLKLNNFFQSSKPYYKRSVVQEQGFYFDPNINNASDNVYLRGYWQNEKYFKEIEKTLKREITLKDHQDQRYYDILARIVNSNSVSLHIRRADYLSDKSKKVFTACTPDYYHLATKIVANRVDAPKLFIFSDDIEWAKNNITPPLPVEFVSDSIKCADRNYQELTLMSACKHNITANSTFGWWGAWLNNNPGKTVITPKRWFVESSREEITPSSWIKI